MAMRGVLSGVFGAKNRLRVLNGFLEEGGKDNRGPGSPAIHWPFNGVCQVKTVHSRPAHILAHFRFDMSPRPPSAPTPAPPSKADKEMLFKGVTCALIGLVIVLAPYVARSGSVRELMGQVAAVGWFALVLGAAFIVQYVVRRVRAGAHRQ